MLIKLSEADIRQAIANYIRMPSQGSINGYDITYAISFETDEAGHISALAKQVNKEEKQ